MRHAKVAFLILSALLVAQKAVVAEDDIDEKDVVVLTEKNFDETLKKSKYALVGSFSCLWRDSIQLCISI